MNFPQHRRGLHVQPGDRQKIPDNVQPKIRTPQGGIRIVLVWLRFANGASRRFLKHFFAFASGFMTAEFARRIAQVQR